MNGDIQAMPESDESEAPPVLRGPKRQHYLPRFYLQGFIGQDGCAGVYDRESHQIRRQQPNNTAVTGHLYTLTDSEGRRRFELEQYLGKVEGAAAAVLPKLLAGNHLDGDERADVAMFTALLAVRTPHFIDSIKAFNGDMVKRVMRMMYDDAGTVMARLKEDPEYLGMSDADLAREAELQVQLAQGDGLEVVTNHQWAVSMAIPLADAIAPIFMARDWQIITAPQKTAFITSDAPVGLSTTEPRANPFWGVGFGSRDALVLLPLDNHHALAMHGNQGRTLARTIERDQVRRINNHIARGTQRFLIARDDALVASVAQASGLHETRWKPRFVMG